MESKSRAFKYHPAVSGCIICESESDSMVVNPEGVED